MRVATQVLQHVFSVTKRLFDIDHPRIMFLELLHQPLEALAGFGQLSGSM